MNNFVKKPEDLDIELDKWLYALKHLTEFEKRPAYLSGPEFDQLFNLAKYANLTREERNMYNTSLKRKWDNKNVLDYAVKTAVTEADQKAREEERTKAQNAIAKTKIEMAVKLKNKGMSLDEIAEITDLSIEEISAL